MSHKFAGIVSWRDLHLSGKTRGSFTKGYADVNIDTSGLTMMTANPSGNLLRHFLDDDLDFFL